jgi:hypothetical protein
MIHACQVWMCDPEEGWYPVGQPVPERQAVKECETFRDHGFRCKALPVGVRPGEDLPRLRASEFNNAT